MIVSLQTTARLRTLLVIAGALGAVAALMVWLAPSHDAASVAGAFWRGSIGTASALFSGTLVRAIPLAIIGVGLSIAFRAGVFNIGAEGQLLLGAVTASLVGLHWPQALGITAVLAALVAAAIGGAVWAGVAAWLRKRFGVFEVISTIMLNFVAANLVSYLVRGPMQEPTRIYPQSDLISVTARLPRFSPDSRLHLGILVALAAGFAAWWFLGRTAGGFRMRAVGASPTAAEVTGRVDVPRVAATALIVSGALAGLAGGIEVTGVTYALYDNLSPGYGFSAIAVAILARLHPLGVLASAFLFAAIETGALGMQRDAGVPSVLAMVLEAVIVLVVVGLDRGTLAWSWRGARAAGTQPA